MALNGWVAKTLQGNRPAVMEYTLKSGETFVKGALVTLDSNEDVLECGADPSTILGMASENAANVVRTGYTNVWLATGDTVFAMMGSTDPTEDDVNQSYGVVKTSSVWLVDVSDTSNTRVYVVDVDVDRKLFFVQVLVANRVVKA